MIHKNSLDDRSFADIVEEALRLIPRYCPEWTNHNPADPGVTLIELFAWMTEMCLYRLNRVPEKTYLALLELAGLAPSPPQSSRALLEFFPAQGYKKPILIKRGLKVASASGGDEELVFETERDLVIAGNRLAACVNRCGEAWTDACRGGGLEPFALFAAHEAVEHVLYVASASFAYLGAGHTLEISFPAAEESSGAQEELVNYLSWEYWDGRAWAELPALRAAPGRPRRDNTLYFRGPVEIAAREVQGREAFWLRAVLAEIPSDPRVLRAAGVCVRTYPGGEGFAPGLCFVNSGTQYNPVDMNSAFRIFSELPSYNEMFYISADEIFSRGAIRASIAFHVSEIYAPGGENQDARFSWEYWNRGAWAALDARGFRDGTFGFRQAGEVSFTVPEDIAKTGVAGEERFWIRVRLLAKDFSLGGGYVKDEKDNWVWKFSSKVHSPVFSRIRISFDAGIEIPEAVFSYTNFRWEDLTQALCARGKSPAEEGGENPGEAAAEVKLFDLAQGSPPELFLGFEEAFPPGDAALYFRLGEKKAARRQELPLFPGEDPGGRTGNRPLCLAWEYRDGSGWAALAVNDYTDCFHESGFVEFVCPAGQARKKEFGKELFWLRLRFVSGSFEARPVVRAIVLNAVYAQNAVSRAREAAGSGTGGPGQKIRPAHGPLLPGPEIYVDEGSVPPAKEIDAMRAEGLAEPYREEAGRVWVRYAERANFYASGPLSRHFVADYEAGVIFFGDGRRGINPPRGKFNIMLASYRTGGGEAGNVAPGLLNVFAQSIPFVAGCNNPFPAEGGADRETVESLKSRAAGIFQSCGRAVTAEDFECLAREASASVGRAFCLPEKNRQGEIRLMIIPFPPGGAKNGCFDEKLYPSRELIRRVRLYLDERRLVGTKLRVAGPVYRAFSVFLAFTVASGVSHRERLKKSVTLSLQKAFHALCGGGGSGWEFGKAVTPGAVLKQLEKTEGILSVDEASLFDGDAGVVVEKLVLRDDELPFLEEVRITDRSGE